MTETSDRHDATNTTAPSHADQDSAPHTRPNVLPLLLLCVISTPAIIVIAKLAGVGTLSAIGLGVLLAGPATLAIIGLRILLCRIFNCHG